MPSEHPQYPDSTDGPILSPFSDTEGPSFQSQKKSNAVLWGFLGVGIFALLALGVFFLLRYVNDPLRTLEPFPVAKYLDGYKSLAGSKFRGHLRVENDLGWKDGVGRLMVFTVRDEAKPIVVLIPPNLAQTFFVKGQSYAAELEVREGGLIYANSCRKE